MSISVNVYKKEFACNKKNGRFGATVSERTLLILLL